MAEQSAVRHAVSSVVEPRLRRPLGELGLVRSLEVEAGDRWRLELAVPEAG